MTAIERAGAAPASTAPRSTSGRRRSRCPRICSTAGRRRPPRSTCSAPGRRPAPGSGSRTGGPELLPIHRWLASADAVDEADPRRRRGAGARPRLRARAAIWPRCAAAGKRGLGVDLSPVAVRLARGRGAEAINGSLWSQVPRAGTWNTILLLDGNIGIGGAPIRCCAGRASCSPRAARSSSRRTRRRADAARPRPPGGAGRRVGVVPLGAGASRRRRGRGARAGFDVEQVRTLAVRTFVTLRRL